MRYFAVILILLATGPVLFAAESSVGLDRCVVLNDANNPNAKSIVAMYFDLPKGFSEKEVVYAELSFTFSLQSKNDSSLCEVMMFPATRRWFDEAIDYGRAAGLADNPMAGSNTIRLRDSNEFHVDITNYIVEVVEKKRVNYGLIAVADLLGDENLYLSADIGSVIQKSANLKIIYK